MRLTKKLLLMFLLASGLVIIANDRSYLAIEESRFEKRAEIASDVDLESHFIDLGISGSIIIYDQNRYFFATNINIVNREDLAARVAVTRLCLEDLGLL